MKNYFLHAFAILLLAPVALGDTVYFSKTTSKEIEKREQEIVNKGYESGFYQKGLCVTPVFTSKSEHEIRDIPTPVMGLDELSNCEGETTLKHSHVADGTSEKPSAADVAFSALNGSAVEVLTPSGDKMIVHANGQVERWNKESQKWDPYTSENGTSGDIENILNVLNQRGDPHGKGLVREMIEAMAECSGNVAGAIGEGKKTCLESKLKEELKKRKAAEEERPRQQQLDAQRRKAQSEQKKTDKKAEKKTSKTKPSKTEPTPKPTPKPTTTVDFSKMKQYGSSQISILNAILSSGQKATGSQISQFNSLKQSYAAEVNRLKTQIEAMGNAEQRSRYYGQLVSINNQIDSKVVSLQRAAASAGLLTLH